MFEGKPPIAPGANGSQQAETASEELCALDWAELTAKLAAARDLRRELAPEEDGTLASFDAHCAQRIASHNGKSPEDLIEDNSKHGVNPEDLANGKGACANSDRHAENGDPPTRGYT